MDRLNQIRKYFDGKLSQEEAHEFLRWFTTAEHEDEVHAELDKLWHSKDHSTIDWDGSQVFQQVLQKRNNVRELEISNREPEEKITSRISWFSVAAVITLLIASTLIFNELTKPDSQPMEVAYAEITKSNPAGQKSRVYLPDGSVVNLNADSKITYSEGFGNGREVYLSGEAFFDVKKDSVNPFTVHSGRLSTTAIGTSFNINAYDADEEVVLVSGKVSVKDSDTQNELLLDPGEKILVKQNDQSFEKTEADLLAYTYWKDGILYFDKVSMSKVITSLERWYGVNIRIQGEVPMDKCTGIFQKNEYLTNVLEILSHTVAFDYELNNKELILIFN